MKIKVTEYEKYYSFNLMPVTQLCGQDIRKKSYMLESLRRYFSFCKYKEGKNKWRDNIRMDDTVIGRKFFSVISIQNTVELLSMIKWSKQSLMVEYMKNMMQKFEWQTHLRTINEEVEAMIQLLNSDINLLGDIELTYAMADVWDMVQKTEVAGMNQIALEEKDAYEVLMIFLNLLEKNSKVNPKKTLVIMENIDHFISKKEYVEIVHKLQFMARNSDTYFILSTSLDGYVECNQELCSGIKVFNDVDFQMPELEQVVNYLEINYPRNKVLSMEQVQEDLIRIIQKIGKKDCLYTIEENVVCKLINQSLLIHDKWGEEENSLEIAFLKD